MKLLITLLSFLGVSCSNAAPSPQQIPNKKVNNITDKIKDALAYIKTNQLNNTIFILIDYNIHSGNNRLFVIEKDSVVYSGLVSHGCGISPWGKTTSASNPIFSNTDNSHCSSLGHYVIGNRGISSWGTKVNYTLHGKDGTNSNALKRLIVLHGWDAVSNTPTYPVGTPEGWGCPAVSINTMLYLDSVLKNKSKVLMWAYN